MTAPLLVRGDGVAKHWAADFGLEPVDFTAVPGQMVCLRGRSGSGKSTLLALLAGLCTPDAGALEWANDLDAVARAQWSNVALVPQTMLLLTELSVFENVALAAPDDPSGVHAVLEALALAGLEHRTIDSLSMGQRQRVAVARAAVAHPRLMLADEPTSHLDARSSELVVAVLRAEADRGAGVVIASHDAAVAASADLVIDLSDERRAPS